MSEMGDIEQKQHDEQEPQPGEEIPADENTTTDVTINSDNPPLSPLAGAPKTTSTTTTSTTSTTNATPTPHSHDHNKLELHGKWTIWFDNPKLAPQGSDWKENLKTMGSFRTIDTFWRIYNNIKPASQISYNSNYSVFRYGVQPSWEDLSNCEGGKFVLTIPKKETKSGKLDEFWLFTVLSIIGETMDADGDQINGAVVSIRKTQDKIALWLKSSDEATCVRIGERWKKMLSLEKSTLRYQTHKDAAASGRSFRNDVHFEV